MEEALGCAVAPPFGALGSVTMIVGGLGIPSGYDMTGLEAFLAKECGDRGANNLLNARNTWVFWGLPFAQLFERKLTINWRFVMSKGSQLAHFPLEWKVQILEEKLIRMPLLMAGFAYWGRWFPFAGARGVSGYHWSGHVGGGGILKTLCSFGLTNTPDCCLVNVMFYSWYSESVLVMIEECSRLSRTGCCSIGDYFSRCWMLGDVSI